MADWEQLARWWLEELAEDAIYQLDVLPLALDLIGDPGEAVIDLGCGEGQVMRGVSGRVIGTDISQQLLSQAKAAGPVVRGRLPDLGWLRSGVIDTAYAVLVLEHLSDLALFEQVRRVVRPGGRMVVVVNHPAFTPDGAGPIMDQTDGEFLWRWGDYFTDAAIAMPTVAGDVMFHHRSLGKVLSAAAEAGWILERLVELGFSSAAIAARPEYRGQEQMPRLLGVRWE